MVGEKIPKLSFWISQPVSYLTQHLTMINDQFPITFFIYQEIGLDFTDYYQSLINSSLYQEIAPWFTAYYQSLLTHFVY